jgi:hypothetical protein
LKRIETRKDPDLMPDFGKILVFLHTGLSLCFASWALALYTNRVDWTARKGKDGKPDGELVTRTSTFDQICKTGLRPADARWRTARFHVNGSEAWRPLEQAWYEQQLEFLRTGATEDNPARQVDHGPRGGDAPTAVLRPGGDLVKMADLPDKVGSLAFYAREKEAALLKTAELKNEIETAANEDKVATNMLHGPKGLHQRIEDEYVKRELIKAGRKDMRPVRLNTQIEYNNLKELRDRLEDRLTELQGVGRKAALGN